MDLWVEDAPIVALAKANENSYHPENVGTGPILKFKFDEQKNAAAWRKLWSQEQSGERAEAIEPRNHSGLPRCSDVTLVGQFETNTLEAGRTRNFLI